MQPNGITEPSHRSRGDLRVMRVLFRRVGRFLNRGIDHSAIQEQRTFYNVIVSPSFTGDEGKMSDSLRWFAFMSYGVGHVLNDLVASMWFTYALVFYHYVMKLSSINAGAVMLVGQLTDAVATAAIGVLSDNVNVICTDRYGRRKTWHLFGKSEMPSSSVPTVRG